MPTNAYTCWCCGYEADCYMELGNHFNFEVYTVDKCRCCGEEFENARQQAEHFKKKMAIWLVPPAEEDRMQ